MILTFIQSLNQKGHGDTYDCGTYSHVHVHRAPGVVFCIFTPTNPEYHINQVCKQCC